MLIVSRVRVKVSWKKDGAVYECEGELLTDRDGIIKVRTDNNEVRWIHTSALIDLVELSSNGNNK